MHRTTHGWAKLAALITMLTLLIPMFAVGTTAQEGKILRVHHTTYPDVVDPQKSSYSNEIDILTLAYEGLTRLDTNLQTAPAAAEYWEYNDDATQITFHLRDGLQYSDGSPLTAENFHYAVERTCDPHTVGSYQFILFDIVGCAEFAGLAMDADGNPRQYTQAEYDAAKTAFGAKALDDLTLQVNLKNPVPYFHTLASMWVFFPVKQEIVAKDPDNWWKTAENHIGNGPFNVSGIAEDQEWDFVANDKYWQGRPKLDGITYVYVEDSTVALEAYRAGDLDIVPLQPPQIAEVKAGPALAKAFVSYPTATTSFLAMDLKQEPFTDKKVREAFSYAFDRETYCAEIRGDCTPTLSWIPAGIPGAIATDKYGFDPEAAQKALAESSYGGPENLPEIKLYFISDFSGAYDDAEWVAGQYRDILGVALTLEPTDGKTLAALTKDPATTPQLTLDAGWTQDYPDAQNWLSVVWSCDAGFAQHLGYCNEAFDRLVKRGDTSVDPTERITAYEQAGQILVDDVPGPFLSNQAAMFVVNPKITGYTPTVDELEWPGEFSSLMTIDIAQ
jgi:oligopeptide transport system substrate-binding protein